jgi:hypothetical protein
MNAAMLMLVASTMTAPAPVEATPATPVLSMGHHVTFVTEPMPAGLDDAMTEAIELQAKPGGTASQTHTIAGKQMLVFGQAGVIFCCSSTGFMAGAMFAFTPMEQHPQLEINVEGNYVHIAGGNGFQIAVNGQWDFKLEGKSFVPYAGLGLGIGHFNVGGAGGTNAGLQLAFGIQKDLESGRAIRLALRFLFIGGGTVTGITAGFAF